MQAVGEKEGETPTAYGTRRPMQFKIHWQWRQGVGDLLWKDASVANSRMPIRLLGHNEWIRGHAPVSLSLSPSLPLSLPPTPSLLLPSYPRSREVGKSWSSYCMNNTGIKFPCNDFFFWGRSVKCTMESIITSSSSSYAGGLHGPYLGLDAENEGLFSKRWCSYAWKVQLNWDCERIM